MIPVRSDVRVCLASGHTEMREGMEPEQSLLLLRCGRCRPRFQDNFGTVDHHARSYVVVKSGVFGCPWIACSRQ